MRPQSRLENLGKARFVDGMDDLRPAELAGSWYPESSAACDELLGALSPLSTGLQTAVGAIVPHGGWRYAARPAFGTLGCLQQSQPEADLVLLFGGHLGKNDEPRVFIEGRWQTPYGPVDTPQSLAAELAMSLSAEPENYDEYYDDNAVEVLVPMVKKLWPNAKLLVCGLPPDAEASRAGAEATILARQHGFKKIVCIGSNDLTHYGPDYRFNPQGRGQAGLDWVKEKNDPKMIKHLVQMEQGRVVWSAAGDRNACSAGAAAAAITACRKLGAEKGELLCQTTSYDESPSGPHPMSFVGYAGVLYGK